MKKMSVYYMFPSGTVRPVVFAVFDELDALDKLKEFCVLHLASRVMAVVTDFDFSDGWDWIMTNGY